ncbi:hypothetical protein ACQ4PT_066699 [Festuca glaucescens]
MAEMASKGTMVVADKAAEGAGSGRAATKATVDSGCKGKESVAAAASGSVAVGESVIEMMQRLNLTQKEATPLILEDEDGEDLPCPEWDLVGKVLAPNTLLVNTISAVLRPAWGNPKGLFIRSMGPNMFMAEFGSETDRSRAAKGGPWWVGKHAVLLKYFDVRIKPENVVFNELPIWARIFNLGYELMNDVCGKSLAACLGKVDRMDVDEKGRAWGVYLRARVIIDPLQPLMRCVSAYSRKRQETMHYEKRKQTKQVYLPKQSAMPPVEGQNNLALVSVQQDTRIVAAASVSGEASDDSVKKQRVLNPRSADPAAADYQPRLPQ